MRLRVLLALVLAAALGLAAGPAGAQTERRLALVIGNNQYRGAGVPKLAVAVADAGAMAQALKVRGFEVTAGYDLDRRQMNRAVDDFVAKLSAGTVAVIYYAGHGVQVTGANYLIPVDMQQPQRADDIVDDAVELGRVIERVRAADARFILAIVDACRDNPFRVVGRSLGGTRGLAAPTSANGAIVLYAAGANQEAIDRLKPGDSNGLFTTEMLRVMEKPGLSVREVIEQVRVAVAAKAKSVGHQQMPALYDEALGDFVLTPGTAAPGPAQTAVQPAPAPAPAFDPRQIEMTYWDSIKESKDTADFQDYLKQYPKGSFAPLARNRIRALKQADQPPPAAPEKVAIVTPPAPPRPAGGQPAPGRSFRDCAECPEMVAVPPGEFQMGTEPAETSREGVPDQFAILERPRHAVAVRAAFAVGKYHVTRGEYARFVRATGRSDGDGCIVWTGSKWEKNGGKSWRDPGFPQTDRDPAVCVSWDDAKAYAAWLSRTTGKSYRLLTEAEWEYAARGGTQAARWWGEEIGSGNASCGGCGSRWDNKQTSPVGSFRPNPFGLYDMLGDAWQWTEDCWTEDYDRAPSDSSIAVAGGDCGRRVVRGGSWDNYPRNLRAGDRSRNDTGDRNFVLGFRVARTL